MVLLFGILFIGCSSKSVKESSVYVATVNTELINESKEKCEVISSLYTLNKEVVLTFDGLSDQTTLFAILDELDQHNIKALFFVPGIRVAEEPNLVLEILKRGHVLGNNTLNRLNLAELDYKDIYKEIKLSHDVILDKTGITPKYLRTQSGYLNDDILYAANECGYDAVITYSINPQDWDMKSASEIAEIVEHRLSRGSIVILNTDRNPEVVKAIPIIASAVKKSGFHFVSLEQMIQNSLPDVEVVPADDRRIEVISYAHTTKPEMALTFDGIGNEEIVQKVLDELDTHNVKATFFLSGNQVAEDPMIALEIYKRGHSIQNNGFSRTDLNDLNYEQIFTEIKISEEIIKKSIGVSPQYFRPLYGQYKDEVIAAATQCGYKGVVIYTIYTQNWDLEYLLSDNVISQFSRGRIIVMNLERDQNVAEKLPHLLRKAIKANLKLVTLEELLADQYETLPIEEIPGYHEAKINLDFEDVEYKLFYTGSEENKEIAITFDDWANDYYLSGILAVLREHNVKSTFFLRGNGVERTPNLARLIFEEGHEIANHTFNHPVITGLSPYDIQYEVVSCHQILARTLGQSPSLYFRPPTGTIDDSSCKVIAACGYKTIVMYDVSPHDWNPEKTINDIVNDTLNKATSGSNIVLHLQDDLRSARALEKIIIQLKADGYKLVTISDLIK